MKFEWEPIKAIEGAVIMLRPVYKDDRGNFSELYREGVLEDYIGFQGNFTATGEREIDGTHFVQQNISVSTIGVLRGMHLQLGSPQGKLVTCVMGEIMDVMIDLRSDSPTFLKSTSLRLGWERGESIYVPPGCAHGFLVLSQYAAVHYNCTSFYEPENDAGVRWDSPELVDHFDGKLTPILSSKDRNLPTVQQFLKGV